MFTPAPSPPTSSGSSSFGSGSRSRVRWPSWLLSLPRPSRLPSFEGHWGSVPGASRSSGASAVFLTVRAVMVPGEECTRVTGPVLAPHQALRDSRGITGDIHLDYSVRACSVPTRDPLLRPPFHPGSGAAHRSCPHSWGGEVPPHL